MDSERKDGFDRDDPLWDLLGRASKPPEPSPYFARRVLRDLDEVKPAVRWFSRLRHFQVWVPVAAAIALMLGAAQLWMPTATRVQGVQEVLVADEDLLPANPDQRIATVLADLDELIAFEDTQYVDDEGIWQ